MITTNKLP